MGNHEKITYDLFPKTGPDMGAQVSVAFHYDTSRLVKGTVVRDDYEDPWRTIIRLDAARHVLGDECQYAVDRVEGANLDGAP